MLKIYLVFGNPSLIMLTNVTLIEIIDVIIDEYIVLITFVVSLTTLENRKGFGSGACY